MPPISKELIIILQKDGKGSYAVYFSYKKASNRMVRLFDGSLSCE
jgi:hypothetical protein